MSTATQQTIPSPFRPLCLATILALSATNPAQGLAAENLPAVVVTASRSAETVDQTLSAVTVIDRQTIEQSGARDLVELLSGSAGIDATANGGRGSQKSLFLRGTNSGHVLLLVDGIRLGSVSLGLTTWSLIPLADIDRIEVVRGPKSSLYGSDAIGGVIQIFTRQGSKRPSASARVGYGTDNTREVAAQFSNGTDSSRLHIAAASSTTDGFDSFKTSEPDPDGYKNRSLSASFTKTLQNKLELGANLLRAQGTNEFDGSYSNSTDFVQQVIGVVVKAHPGETWQSTFRLGQSQDNSDNLLNGAWQSTFDSTQDQASWINELTVNDNSMLLVGLDYLKDKISSDTTFTETSRDNKAVLLQYRFFGEKQDLQVAARYDDNQQFGGHTTGNLAWGYTLNPGLRTTASVGTAYKAPSFNALYWPGFGDPNLKPEQSISYELGLSGKQAGLQWDTRAYYTQADNMVIWYGFTPANANLHIKGLEQTLATQVLGWQVKASLNWLNAKDRNAGKKLVHRPDWTYRLTAGRQLQRWNLQATVRGAGSSYDDSNNTTRIAGHHVFNLSGDYRMNKAWLLRGNIRNLLDRNYETVSNYTMPGREIMFSLVYQNKS